MSNTLNALSQPNTFATIDFQTLHHHTTITVQREDDLSTRETLTVDTPKMDALKARVNALAGSDITFETWNSGGGHTYAARLVGLGSNGLWVRMPKADEDTEIPFSDPFGINGHLRSVTIGIA